MASTNCRPLTRLSLRGNPNDARTSFSAVAAPVRKASLNGCGVRFKAWRREKHHGFDSVAPRSSNRAGNRGRLGSSAGTASFYGHCLLDTSRRRCVIVLGRSAIRPYVRPPRFHTLDCICSNVASVGAVTASRLQTKRWTAFVILFLSTVSHGVLDAMTTGGLGVAFFSPFSNERLFLPWRVIEVSPIGVSRFFSLRGLEVLASEVTTVWIPCLLFALTGVLVRRQWRRETKE
jgi:hypothetical protein